MLRRMWDNLPHLEPKLWTLMAGFHLILVKVEIFMNIYGTPLNIIIHSIHSLSITLILFMKCSIKVIKLASFII